VAIEQEAKLAEEAMQYLNKHKQRSRNSSLTHEPPPSSLTKRQSSIHLAPITEIPTEQSYSPPGPPDPEKVVRVHQLLREFCRELAAVVVVRGARRSMDLGDLDDLEEEEEEDAIGESEGIYSVTVGNTDHGGHGLDRKPRPTNLNNDEWIWGWWDDSGSEDNDILLDIPAPKPYFPEQQDAWLQKKMEFAQTTAHLDDKLRSWEEQVYTLDASSQRDYTSASGSEYGGGHSDTGSWYAAPANEAYYDSDYEDAAAFQASKKIVYDDEEADFQLWQQVSSRWY
jgi:hypothetical protein